MAQRAVLENDRAAPLVPSIDREAGRRRDTSSQADRGALRPATRIWAFPLLAAGLALAFCLDLALGSVTIPLSQVALILAGGEAQFEPWQQIVLSFRLPKALTAALAGASLALSGLQMQTLFRNPLASPGILGINSGASLGVALAILGFGGVQGASLTAGLSAAGDFGLALAASLGAAAALAVILSAARRVRNAATLLVLGLMIGYIAAELVSLLLYFSLADSVQNYLTWTFGSFGGVTWSRLTVMGPVLAAGLALGLASVKSLNALLLGEEYARSLGASVGAVRFRLIAGTAVLAGTVTAFCGPIAFLGVAVPHLCRGLFATSDHRVLAPAVVLAGAALALAADLISQLPGSALTLPLNTITALIGAPVVVWAVMRRDTRPLM